MTPASILSEIHDLLAPGSVDELRAFRVIARRVMGRGREQYGATVIANDKRDYRDEKAEEKADWLWYDALEEVRQYDERRDRDTQSVDATDSEATGEFSPVANRTAEEVASLNAGRQDGEP